MCTVFFIRINFSIHSQLNVVKYDLPEMVGGVIFILGMALCSWNLKLTYILDNHFSCPLYRQEFMLFFLEESFLRETQSSELFIFGTMEISIPVIY